MDLLSAVKNSLDRTHLNLTGEVKLITLGMGTITVSQMSTIFISSLGTFSIFLILDYLRTSKSKKVNHLLIVIIVSMILISIPTLANSFQSKTKIKEFDVNENAKLGIIDKQKAFENCRNIKLADDPDLRTSTVFLKEDCFMALALETLDSNICPSSSSSYGDCFIKVAIKTGNISSCNEEIHEKWKVQDISGGTYDKSFRNGCYTKFAIYNRNLEDCSRIVQNGPLAKYNDASLDRAECKNLINILNKALETKNKNICSQIKEKSVIHVFALNECFMMFS